MFDFMFNIMFILFFVVFVTVVVIIAITAFRGLRHTQSPAAETGAKNGAALSLLRRADT